MVVKAGGVWYEIADHLGHISLLCVSLKRETVEAQLVYCSRRGASSRDEQTYENVVMRSFAQKHQETVAFVCSVADVEGLERLHVDMHQTQGWPAFTR